MTVASTTFVGTGTANFSSACTLENVQQAKVTASTFRGMSYGVRILPRSSGTSSLNSYCTVTGCSFNNTPIVAVQLQSCQYCIVANNTLLGVLAGGTAQYGILEQGAGSGNNRVLYNTTDNQFQNTIGQGFFAAGSGYPGNGTTVL